MVKQIPKSFRQMLSGIFFFYGFFFSSFPPLPKKSINNILKINKVHTKMNGQETKISQATQHSQKWKKKNRSMVVFLNGTSVWCPQAQKSWMVDPKP